LIPISDRPFLSENYLSDIYFIAFIGRRRFLSAFLIDLYLIAFKCFYEVNFPLAVVDGWYETHVVRTN